MRLKKEMFRFYGASKFVGDIDFYRHLVPPGTNGLSKDKKQTFWSETSATLR
jgi:hypothetical protein